MAENKEIPASWLDDCYQVLQKYRGDVSHAQKVARLAEGLFDWTREFSGLEDSERIPLVAAGLLHDIGHVVGAAKHHRHSAWLLRNDEALAAWPSDLRETVAWLALNHRKSRVREARGKDRADLGRLWRMASILRLADVFDRAHNQRTAIHEMQVDADNATILFVLSEFDIPASAEAIRRKAAWAAEAWDAELIFTCGDDRLSVTPGD
jgi:exopolyphosphatase/pppGpp-phosphohydrolase